MVALVGLQCVIVAFPGHICLLFYIFVNERNKISRESICSLFGRLQNDIICKCYVSIVLVA